MKKAYIICLSAVGWQVLKEAGVQVSGAAWTNFKTFSRSQFEIKTFESMEEVEKEMIAYVAPYMFDLLKAEHLFISAAFFEIQQAYVYDSKIIPVTPKILMP